MQNCIEMMQLLLQDSLAIWQKCCSFFSAAFSWEDRMVQKFSALALIDTLEIQNWLFFYCMFAEIGSVCSLSSLSVWRLSFSYDSGPKAEAVETEWLSHQ